MREYAKLALLFTVTACGVDQSRDNALPAGAAPKSTDLVASDDSVLDGLLPGRSALTPNGDTLTDLGGGMLDDDYGASEYRRNGLAFLRIAKSVGKRPDGRPIWSTRARLALPPTDSSQHLLYAGMCGTDNKSDRYVLAIAVTEGDSVYRDIRHAWRFERANETLRPIATTNVACWDIGAD